MKNRMMNKQTNVNQAIQRFSIRKYKKSVSSVMVGMFLVFGFSFNIDASEKENIDQTQTEERTETETQTEEDQPNEAELVEQEEALLAEQENAELLISALENISDEDKAYYIDEIVVASDVETAQIVLEEAIVEDEAIYQEILKEEEAKKAEAKRLKAEEAAKKQAEKEAAQEAEQEEKKLAEKEQAEREEAERKEQEAAESEKSEEETEQQDQNQEQDNDEEEVENEQSEQDSDTENDDSENKDDVEESQSEPDNTEESKELVEKQPEEIEEEVVEETPEQSEVPEEPITEPVQPEEEIVEKTPEYVEPEQPVEEPLVKEDVEVEKQPSVNFQKGVNDAYRNAQDKAQLEAHLTNIVNTTFKMSDTEAFMKSLEVNLEDLTPEEFTYMLLKHVSENIDAQSVVVTRDDNDDVLIAKGVKDLSSDLGQAKEDGKNNLSMMFYLDVEARAAYQHQIDQAGDHSQITAIMMVANAYNNMNMPDYVSYGNHPSQNTKSILKNAIEVSPSIKSLSVNHEALNSIKDLNYIPFELSSERVDVEGSYNIQLQLDERLAQHIAAITVHPHNSFITQPFKRLVNDAGQLTNVWQIDYDRLFSSEDDIFMTAKNGLIMLEDSIETIMNQYDHLETHPLTYQSAVMNEDTGNLVDSTVERNRL